MRLEQIKYSSDKEIRERVLKNDYSKVYTLSDISKWIEYGLRKGIIQKGNSKDNVELMVKWIDILGKGKKNIQL